MTSAARRAVVAAVSVLVTALILLAAAIAVSSQVHVGCARCHSKASFVNATHSSSHSGVSCRACHGGSTLGSQLQFGSAQVLGMYLHVSKVDPSLARVDSGACVKCHGKQLKGVAVGKGLKILHSKCVGRSACTDCHSTVAHGRAVKWPRESTMEGCFSCHGGSGPTQRCSACHTSQKLPADRIKTGQFAVTHGPNHVKTHGMGDMKVCSACHPSDKCARCHGAGVPHSSTFIAEHGTAAKSPDAKCLTCHKKTLCDECHGLQMPHPTSFVKTHSTTVAKSGKALCQRCHQTNDCRECHTNHAHPTTVEEMKRLTGTGAGEKK